MRRKLTFFYNHQIRTPTPHPPTFAKSGLSVCFLRKSRSILGPFSYEFGAFFLHLPEKTDETAKFGKCSGVGSEGPELEEWFCEHSQAHSIFKWNDNVTQESCNWTTLTIQG